MVHSSVLSRQVLACIPGAAKSNPLKLLAVFSATDWNLCAKFYMFGLVQGTKFLTPSRAQRSQFGLVPLHTSTSFERQRPPETTRVLHGLWDFVSIPTHPSRRQFPHPNLFPQSSFSSPLYPLTASPQPHPHLHNADTIPTRFPRQYCTLVKSRI